MNFNEKNIIFRSEVESTNNYAMQLVQDKAGEGTVVLTHYQNRGRGQCGNYWESEAQKNLLFSFILYPVFLEVDKQFYLSKIISIALTQVLEKYIDNVSIKWPNDIYAGEKKITGILIENLIKGTKLDCSIAGIGVNINQEIFKSGAPNPVSLKQLTGRNYDIQEILHSFFVFFDDWYTLLKNKAFDEIDKVYFAKLFWRKGWHWYRANGRKFEAQITGTGEYGQLILKDKSGKFMKFMFKEVEFVLKS